MDAFPADESVDYRIIKTLREKGFSIQSVVDINPGMSDKEVLDLCVANNLILITEDKDFGELTIRLKKPNKGIILLRLAGVLILDKKKLVLNTFNNNSQEFKNAFSVLNMKKLRIRRY